MHRYGCHNRPDAPREMLVQDGWVDTGMPGPDARVPIRLPRMVTIPVRHANPDCQYTLERPDDPQCDGCCWQRPKPVRVRADPQDDLRLIDELLLPARITSELKAADIWFIGHLAQHTERDLLLLPQIGRKALGCISRALALRGLTLGVKRCETLTLSSDMETA